MRSTILFKHTNADIFLLGYFRPRQEVLALRALCVVQFEAISMKTERMLGR